MKKIFALLAFLFCYTIAFSQTQLTEGISTDSGPYSNPDRYLKYKNQLYFVSTDPRVGTEIWKTDGTEAGTVLLKDINLGPDNSVVSNFVAFKDKIYFIATDGISGNQFWSTDGTSEGTIKVTNNLPFPAYQLVVCGGYIYFITESYHVMDIWKFDGTVNGLIRIKGNIPIWNSPDNLTSALGLVFFSAQPEGSNKTRVWRTDGTEAGTFPITEELDGNGSSFSGTPHPTQFIEYHGALYFIARSQKFTNGWSVGIVKLDGTVAGTQYVMGIHPGNTQLIEFSDVIIHRDKMYFSFFDIDYNRYFVWESGGTESSTVSVYDESYQKYFSPSYLASSGDYLYFTGGNQNGGTSLVQYNSVSHSYQSLKEIKGQSGKPFIFFAIFSACNIYIGSTNQIFIRVVREIFDDGELWTSNGTSGGTVKVSAIAPRFGMVIYNDQLYYTGVTENGTQLWRSDGTLAGSKLFKRPDSFGGGMTFDSPLMQLGNVALFSASDENFGTELWITDGTKPGTKVLKDLVAGTSGSFPSDLMIKGDKAYFVAYNVTSREVFSSDGTAAGTRAVTNLSAIGASASKLFRMGENRFIVQASKTNGTTSLFSMDDSGTVTEIKNFGVNSFSSPFYISEASTSGEVLYMLLLGVGEQLWKTDGTAAGTIKVKDFNEADQLTTVGNNAYFVVHENFASANRVVYFTDGTEAGTTPVKTIEGTTPSSLSLFPFNNKLLFTCLNATTASNELWITDGVGNTNLLKNIHVNTPIGSGVPTFTRHHDKVYFAATTAASGNELWETDGTSTGTRMLKDIVADGPSSKPNHLVSDDDVIYFSAYTASTGFEIWSSDGVNETKLVVDVIPGPVSSNAYGFLNLNDNLIFIAESQSQGKQLFSYASITGIEDDVHSRLSAFPNPATDNITLQSGLLTGGSLTVYNASGLLVTSQTTTMDELEVNLSGLPSGLYMLKVKKGSTTRTIKVIKK